MDPSTGDPPPLWSKKHLENRGGGQVTLEGTVLNQDLLNQRTTVEEEVLNSPQYPVKESMGDPPSLLEVCDAISALHDNKATGPDGIPAEVLMAGGANLHDGHPFQKR